LHFYAFKLRVLRVKFSYRAFRVLNKGDKRFSRKGR
jgi:hypothetical protein